MIAHQATSAAAAPRPARPGRSAVAGSPAAPRPPRRRRRGGIRAPWWFVLPAIAAYLFIVVVPSVNGAFYSFTDWNGLRPDWSFVGFGNFTAVFTDRGARAALVNTVSTPDSEEAMKLEGVLFFPVTPFGADGGVDEGALAKHVENGIAAGAGGVFVACGTGEFHALTPAEIECCARIAVTAAAGRVPVYAAAGGPLPVALDHVERLGRVGVDGVLLLPPYLVGGPQRGVFDYVRAVAGATSLRVIFYQRGNAVPTPRTAVEIARIPNVVGIKDGVGNIELMHRTVLTVRRAVSEEFQFFNGLPTAEMTVPAYLGIGVPLYSSAVFAFAPEIALRFHRAVTTDDTETVRVLLAEFYLPLVELRDEVPGYAVALIKAGVRLRGLDVGGVRPPLLDPTTEHVDRLETLLQHGLELADR